MYRFIKNAVAAICILGAVPLMGQTDDSTKTIEIPSSILRIGYAPINQSQSELLTPGINIDWEKPLSPNFTLGLNLYRDLSKASRYRSDERSVVGEIANRSQYEYKDIRTSLSLNATYYFTPYAYDGFYAALRVNNLAAETVIYGDYLLDTESSRELTIEPRVGAYLGYRKVFGSGFYLDGSAGVIINPVQSAPNLKARDYLDFKLSIGWQLWRGKKE